MVKSDPLAAALDAAHDEHRHTNRSKIEILFGERPEVLDSIRRARRERKLSYAQIARVLTRESGTRITDGVVSGWLATQGID